MTHTTKILLSLLLLLLVPYIAQAYCPPYFAKIDSITPQYDCLDINDRTKSCGGAIEIISHCPGEFYFYDAEGKLDENLVLISNKEWEKNYQKYQELKEETGKSYLGCLYRSHEPHFDFSDCVEGEPRIVDGVNVCDRSEIEKAGSGTVVKYWTIKMFYKDDNKDIIIEGRTIYEKPSWVSNTGSPCCCVSLAPLGLLVGLGLVAQRRSRR